MDYKTFSNKDFVVETVFLNCNNKVHVSILGWEDMNHFIQLCKEEGGGVLPHIEFFFKKLPVNKKTTKSELENLVTFMDSNPSLKSNNGKIIYNYDLHIWCSDYYFIFNFTNRIFIEKRLNLIEKLLGRGIMPKWQK